MKNNENENSITLPTTGIFVKGLVVGSTARYFAAKDDRPASVQVRHEVATSPGLVVAEEYFDPAATSNLRVKDEEILEYPQMPHLGEVTLKAATARIMGDTLVFKGIERL